MWFGVVSLFPQMFAAITECGVSARAVKRGLVQLECWNPRDYARNSYGSVDDRPYGGGPGMVMSYQPVYEALEAAKIAASGKARTVALTPQGRRLDQAGIRRLADCSHLVFLATRYEGVDERLMQHVDEELSLGDYVLSGGELAAMAVMDAVMRLLPGVLGDPESAEQDSFMTGLLDHPHYTRPECIAEQRVPKVLLSGDHAAIARWRLRQALGRTWLRRPDLLMQYDLQDEHKILLDEFIQEYRSDKV